jgi:DNA invertase Pin-like site-specific DNA recombinase
MHEFFSQASCHLRSSINRQAKQAEPLKVLRAVARRHGWEVAEEYVDHGVSGSKGRNERAAFDRMLTAATRRQFDLIAAWSVDRLGRSLQHLAPCLAEIHGKRIDLYPISKG